MTLKRLTPLMLVPLLVVGCNADHATGPEPSLVAALSPAGTPLLATGSGHVPFGSGLRVFTFHAKDNGDGSATGSYRINLTEPGLFFEVDVSCMTIEGNTAWIAGHISDTNAGFINVGSVSYFFATDNGEGSGSPADVVSTARINDVEGEDLLFCADRPLLLASFPIDQGNVQVR